MKEENGTINYEEFDLIPVFYSPFDSVMQEVKEKRIEIRLSTISINWNLFGVQNIIKKNCRKHCIVL